MRSQIAIHLARLPPTFPRESFAKERQFIPGYSGRLSGNHQQHFASTFAITTHQQELLASWVLKWFGHCRLSREQFPLQNEKKANNGIFYEVVVKKSPRRRHFGHLPRWNFDQENASIKGKSPSDHLP
ncbi:MAG: hypothetical protein U0894_05325 [Pirellulales bacterium]